MLCNSLYSSNAVEHERDTIYRELIECQKEQFDSTIELGHRGVKQTHKLLIIYIYIQCIKGLR
jgi:hypothetical protein